MKFFLCMNFPNVARHMECFTNALNLFHITDPKPIKNV